MSENTRAATSTANAAAIETLRRRKRRLGLVLLGFILLMPIGCVGPFSLFSIAPEGAQTPLVIAGLLLPFVGLGGLLLMLGDRSKCHRSLALAEQADRMGLTFVAKPAADEYRWLEQIESYSAADTHLGGVNRLAGRSGEQEVWVIDYTYGMDNHGYRQTVFVLRGAARGRPDFVVTPRGWLDKLGRLLGDRGVEVPGRPDIAQRFVVASPEPERTGWCLLGAADWLIAAGDVTVEVREGDLIAQRYNRLVKPDEYPGFLQQLQDLEARLRPSADRKRDD